MNRAAGLVEHPLTGGCAVLRPPSRRCPLAQLPVTPADQPILVRSDSAAASTRLAWRLRERQVRFSLGMKIDAHVREAILAQPEQAWTSAVDPDGQPRAGADDVELTGRIDLHTWPVGTRAICRREDAHPGTQLRFTDHDGHRFQVFLTDQPDADLARLELRHRQRARVEDRIRAAKATGLRNLPFDLLRRNAVWLELVLTAQDLTGWAQALLLDGELAVAEPKTLRYRLLHVARPDHPPRSPDRPSPATQLAVGGRAGTGVHPAASPPSALLTPPPTAPTASPTRSGSRPAATSHVPRPTPDAAASTTTRTSKGQPPQIADHTARKHPARPPLHLM
jgi:hypothetical protein